VSKKSGVISEKRHLDEFQSEILEGAGGDCGNMAQDAKRAVEENAGKHTI
jgi:hypothetical protein